MSTRARRGPAGDGLLIVGLVGRAGSGKSAVANILLAADGATVIEADLVGHEVTDQDPEVRAALAREYGDDIYRPDGRLDRERVAANVFRDPVARARLDRLVHPRLVARLEQRLQGLCARGTRGLVVLDAALLLEWGLERDCDAVIAVSAPPAEQVRRTDEAFSAAADVTLDNAGSIEDLARVARAAVAALRAARAERG